MDENWVLVAAGVDNDNTNSNNTNSNWYQRHKNYVSPK